MDSNAAIARIKSEPTEERFVDQQATDQQASEQQVTEHQASEQQATGQQTTDDPTANQSTSMADEPTANQLSIMANQLENNDSAEQPNLFLNCSTRIQLISSLVHLSDTLQSSKPIEKERTCKEINDSILLLVNLTSFNPTQPSASDGLKLSRTERSNLINHLVDFRDAVLSDQKATDKASVISENKKLVNQLMKLPRQETNDLAGGARSVDENTDEPRSKRQRGMRLLREFYSLHISI